jgi:hypothetical protein
MTERISPQDDQPAPLPTAAEIRTLKNFRYVVGAVNDDALRVWEEIWEQFRDGATPTGTLAPQSQGFTPACGWPEFLEKLWLMKHYLDYIHRFCREP